MSSETVNSSASSNQNEVSDAAASWIASDVALVASALEHGTSLEDFPPELFGSNRFMFLKLYELAVEAYGGEISMAAKIDSLAVPDPILQSPAAAPLLRFFLGAMARFSTAMNEKPKATASEARAALAEALLLTEPSAGAPTYADAGRIVLAFKDAYHDARLLGHSIVLSKKNALDKTFERRYGRKSTDSKADRKLRDRIEGLLMAFDELPDEDSFDGYE